MAEQSRRLWLCIDPGITTGWALLDDDGEVKGTSVWGTAELKTSLDAVIRMCFTAGYELTVVEELMPKIGGMGGHAAKLQEVLDTIHRLTRDTYEIPTIEVMPGEWKPSRVARTTTVYWRFNNTPLMIHQKDAIRMGRYVIDRERNAD